MAKPRDPWLALDDLIAHLRAQRAALKAEAAGIRDQAGTLEDRHAAVKREFEGLGVAIRDLEQIAGMHADREQRRPLALPPRPPVVQGTVVRGARSDGKVYDRSSPDHVHNLIGEWVRSHGGGLVVADMTAWLLARGRYPTAVAAAQGITSHLQVLKTGFARVSRGVYRFYELDGAPLHLDEAPEENVA